MKKTYTTNGGKNVTFFTKENSHSIYAEVEGAKIGMYDDKYAKVGWCYDDLHPFEITDYNDEFDIHAFGNDFEEVFNTFCEDFVSHLNIREVKRAEFVKKLERELAAYKETSLVTCDSTAFNDLCELVEKNADDADF